MVFGMPYCYILLYEKPRFWTNAVVADKRK